MPHFASKIRVLRTLLPACLLFVALTPALARTVTVSCDETTISNVLKTLDLQASNTIRVTGTHWNL